MAILDNYQLDDRYLSSEGRVYLTGIQALARIPIQQLLVDRLAGLNTAVFTSGYPGSPVGGFDLEMARAAALLPDLPIVNQPAVNEELGATAVMGSQLASEQPDCNYEGILGIWYGKAPGLDRAGDALRHAVFAGTSRHGGAIAIVGDDPAAKSSTIPTSSDATLVDLHMPILYPGDVQETLDLGMHAVALSRLTGVWSALKIVTNVADGTSTVDLSLDRVVPVIPDLEINGRPHVHHPSGNLLTPYTLEMERDFKEVRSELVRRYMVANRLNHVTVDPSDAWIGIISSGFTYHEMLHALRRIGLGSPEEIEAAGIRIMHMQVPVPFEPANVRNFARGLGEIVVVEEKNPTLEWLVKDALYGGPDQPQVVGKTHPDGRTLMPSYGILDADTIMVGLHERLADRIGDRLAPVPTPPSERIMIPLADARKPFFCSGCPHNWGTKVPEGALVGAGIGCHGMSMLMDEDRVGATAGLAAMGGEGMQWVGMAPFVERDHFFQNLGDGTFFHSGQLAIQAAVGAGVSMTYKLLFNGTVAMTGGQETPDAVGVPEIATALLAFGVRRVLVTTEDTSRYQGIDLPNGVEVWDRTRIVEAQEVLADIEGVTVLIHDQACAAQQRRFRRRGLAETPIFRVAINHRICEACGDCGDVSNCLSLHTVETPLGPKTTVDQSSCNIDTSCLEGDCPSFMTVAVQPGASGGTAVSSPPVDDLPDPTPLPDSDIVDIRLAGIGGTGVVTAAQLLGTAAMLDGIDVRGLDQTGLSQKAGPVVSDLRLSRTVEMASNLVGAGEADAIVAFDLLVAADSKALAGAQRDHTVVVASTTTTPTGAMIGHPELGGPAVADLIGRVGQNTRTDANHFVDSGAMTVGLLGSSEQANVFLLGVAVQVGAVPVSPTAVERAIELNGVAVESNLAAFRWGRTWVVDPTAVEAAASSGVPVEVTIVTTTLPPDLRDRVRSTVIDAELVELLDLLAADLVGYQDVRCATGFLDVVASVAAAEQRVSPDSSRLTEAVARGLHKLTAYKDEYEVARLLSGPESRAAAESVGGPGARATWHLHPPLLAAIGVGSKLRLPAGLGRPLMSLLSHGRRLRGTPVDPFGRTRVRRLEREMLVEYRSAIGTVTNVLSVQNLDAAVDLASSAMDVRGFEDLKVQRGEAFLEGLKARLTTFA
ncbi:MAG: indolepyruvate ferredoxin oxidoreductase family protein [Acidimicrobiia bacterium]|nr:indolepyruvate ferredoxin oxidoreductase family protein [Acidimicrobiia bacterium]